MHLAFLLLRILATVHVDRVTIRDHRIRSIAWRKLHEITSLRFEQVCFIIVGCAFILLSQCEKLAEEFIAICLLLAFIENSVKFR